MFAVWHRHTHRIAGWLAAEKKKKKKRRKKKKGPSISAATAAAAESLRRQRAAASWATGATTVEASKSQVHSHFAFSSAAAAAVEKEPRLGPLDPLLLSTHTHKVTLGTYRYIEVLCSFSKRERERKKESWCLYSFERQCSYIAPDSVSV